MADQIHVVPAQLREAATHHEQVSDYLRNVPSSHAAILESLDSLGPVFGELRDAGRELLELRRQCYEQQADDHATMARSLRVSATAWDQHEHEATRNLANLDNFADGGR
jgi:Excreted virulence factor EspC, type VII ESX diderm